MHRLNERSAPGDGLDEPGDLDTILPRDSCNCVSTPLEVGSITHGGAQLHNLIDQKIRNLIFFHVVTVNHLTLYRYESGLVTFPQIYFFNAGVHAAIYQQDYINRALSIGSQIYLHTHFSQTFFQASDYF
jgi:hypothetical protein